MTGSVSATTVRCIGASGKRVAISSSAAGRPLSIVKLHSPAAANGSTNRTKSFAQYRSRRPSRFVAVDS